MMKATVVVSDIDDETIVVTTGINEYKVIERIETQQLILFQSRSVTHIDTHQIR